MKIAVLVRTLNEERNIADFCATYDWVDKILVADGGSTDDTARIAEHFPNVWVREFEERIDHDNGIIENPQGRHLNFLIDWGLETEANWLIFDDCDCVPNFRLRQDGRQLMSGSGQPGIFAYRLHLWGSDKYFPKMNHSGPSLWAWRPDVCQIASREDNNRLAIDGVPETGQRLNLEAPPYCLIHNTYPDEKTVRYKMAFYEARGIPFQHPLKSVYAPPESLPGWVYNDL